MTEVEAGSYLVAMARDIRAGLSKENQKELSCKYLYDDVGSALFEVISLLPEYGLTRADERLIRQYSEDVIRKVPKPLIVAELGSGSGKKTRWILQALSQQQRTVYSPIEISSAALAQCERELGHLERVTILGFEKEYLEGLSAVTGQRSVGEHLLILFLGSTIGNFDRDAGIEFLGAVRRSMIPGDSLLLSTDLVKPAEQIIPAYDDPLGVTAAFNLNILTRINRELGADFDLSRFRHEARWESQERRVEMHLRSLADQTIVFSKASFEIEVHQGETLWTESSHKFTAEEVSGIAERTGYRCEVQWIDREWPFALNLFIAI